MSDGIALAYQRLLDAVGQTSRVHVGRVSARDFQRFAYAVGHVDATFVSREHAAAQAPPIYLSAVMGWDPGPVEGELRLDGSEPTATSGLPVEGLRLMGAGQDMDLHTPVVDGMKITMDVSVDHVELKHGRSGDLILLRILREYADHHGAPVLTCRESFIAR